jgi:hypothetical protein
MTFLGRGTRKAPVLASCFTLLYFDRNESRSRNDSPG